MRTEIVNTKTDHGRARISPFVALPPLEDLPPAAHELAQEWTRLDEQLQAADRELIAAKRAKAQAPAEDGRAIREAVLAGRTVEDPKANQKAAARRLAQAERAPDIVLAERNRVGEQLVKVLQEPDSIAWLRERLEEKASASVKKFRTAVAKARRSVEEAKAEMVRSADLAAVLDGLLAARPRGIAPAPLPASASVNWGALSALADEVEQRTASPEALPKSRAAVVRHRETGEEKVEEVSVAKHGVSSFWSLYLDPENADDRSWDFVRWVDQLGPMDRPSSLGELKAMLRSAPRGRVVGRTKL